MKCFWVSLPPIIGDVMVVAGDREWMMKCARATKAKGADRVDDEFVGTAFTIKRDNVGSFVFMWVGGGEWVIDTYDTVAHEVSHAVDLRFKDHNIPPGYESTEVRALLVGRLVGMVLAGLRGVSIVKPPERWAITLPRPRSLRKK